MFVLQCLISSLIYFYLGFLLSLISLLSPPFPFGDGGIDKEIFFPSSEGNRKRYENKEGGTKIIDFNWVNFKNNLTKH
jgi:hypothetical protein